MADNSLAVRDPYVWHNDTVLKNRLDIHDEAQLLKAELAFSAARLATLELGPRSTGMPWLCHIHRTLFQDLYSWAGELRSIDIWRDETPYCHCEYIEKEGNALMSALEDEQQLTNLTQDEFVARLAHYYCEIYVLHPFRAGNDRTQRIFFEQLALHAGYLLTWDKLERETWRTALFNGVSGDLASLTAQFAKVVSPAR
ncbi:MULTISPECIES: putative adenosine monophosphate-protein transferase Fic [unclassified Pantoea]|uniref:putative adenosine monophosphate-protein transferase Fic n=1 Tax=unclassified Pantoea TaxID=2630326 RepID=UPI001CD52A55|nr:MULTISPECIES: putative adenosine monophosphate-protein transferase Fic [unclassified Pantoea]MCA1179300.1 putative adenosine monophosphate-protein transferase Fic [Pantoea sp. alder69]MCA1251697.1 putative adenosine monophosphate-protein transferase Fic [Pantoea sp. alder70]MCA1267789.1 putative adenosine monophosphate-protein transferase Fic [Pantoea sp. alder81]